MKLPGTIKIAGFDIKVVEWHPMSAQGERAFGEWCSCTMEIRIAPHRPAMCVLQTFLHEINHAIFWVYDITSEDKEERIVDLTATAWAQVYRDNPEIIKWIATAIKR